MQLHKFSIRTPVGESDQLHAPAALPAHWQPPVPKQEQAALVPEPVWKLQK